MGNSEVERVNRLEELYKELKQKDKELDEYIETHRNHLSDEAEAIRKDIYRITDEINLLEKAREEAKEYEDFKNRLLQHPITFLTEENLDKLEDHCRKAIHYERGVEHKVVLELLVRYKEFLAEREEDKKEIEKLKEEVETHTYLIFTPIEEALKDYIPKQKVKEELEKAEKENEPYEQHNKESRMYWINEGKINLAKKLLEDK